MFVRYIANWILICIVQYIIICNTLIPSYELRLLGIGTRTSLVEFSRFGSDVQSFFFSWRSAIPIGVWTPGVRRCKVNARWLRPRVRVEYLMSVLQWIYWQRSCGIAYQLSCIQCATWYIMSIAHSGVCAVGSICNTAFRANNIF